MENDNFKMLLNKSNELHAPNLDFTKQVMAKVEHSMVHKTEFKPLISKRVGWGVTACYSLILLLPFLSGSAEAAALLIEQVSRFGLDLKQLKQNSNLISLILIVFTSFAFLERLISLKSNDKQLVA